MFWLMAYLLLKFCRLGIENLDFSLLVGNLWILFFSNVCYFIFLSSEPLDFFIILFFKEFVVNCQIEKLLLSLTVLFIKFLLQFFYYHLLFNNFNLILLILSLNLLHFINQICNCILLGLIYISEMYLIILN